MYIALVDLLLEIFNLVSSKWGKPQFLAAYFTALYSGFICLIQKVSLSSKLSTSKFTSSKIIKAKFVKPYFNIAREIGLPFCELRWEILK